MELVVFTPTTLVGHMAKHCKHMVSSPDENSNIGGVYRYKTHLFCLAIQVGLYGDEVECWIFLRKVVGSILSLGKR